jgi:Protein of unknown function (DUF3892)
MLQKFKQPKQSFFMTTQYITAIIVGTDAKSQSEINEYRISDTKSNSGNWFTKKVFFETEYSNKNSYYSYNYNNFSSQLCEVKTSVNDEKYLQTVPDTTTADNLLSLPTYKRASN